MQGTHGHAVMDGFVRNKSDFVLGDDFGLHAAKINLAVKEALAASAMRQLGLDDATLYLNQAPCVWSNGGGCNAMLPRMLGEGRQLRIVVPGQVDQVYRGVAP